MSLWSPWKVAGSPHRNRRSSITPGSSLWRRRVSISWAWPWPCSAMTPIVFPSKASSSTRLAMVSTRASASARFWILVPFPSHAPSATNRKHKGGKPLRRRLAQRDQWRVAVAQVVAEADDLGHTAEVPRSVMWLPNVRSEWSKRLVSGRNSSLKRNALRCSRGQPVRCRPPALRPLQGCSVSRRPPRQCASRAAAAPGPRRSPAMPRPR